MGEGADVNCQNKARTKDNGIVFENARREFPMASKDDADDDVYSKTEIDEKLEDLRVFLQDVLFQKLEILESRYSNSSGEGLYKAFLQEGLLKFPTKGTISGASAPSARQEAINVPLPDVPAPSAATFNVDGILVKE